MPNSRLEQRKQGFKSKGASADELRRRREEASVEIRKVKRDETLSKRRGLGSASTSIGSVSSSSSDEDLDSMDSPKPTV